MAKSQNRFKTRSAIRSSFPEFFFGARNELKMAIKNRVKKKLVLIKKKDYTYDGNNIPFIFLNNVFKEKSMATMLIV